MKLLVSNFTDFNIALDTDGTGSPDSIAIIGPKAQRVQVTVANAKALKKIRTSFAGSLAFRVKDKGAKPVLPSPEVVPTPEPLFCYPWAGVDEDYAAFGFKAGTVLEDNTIRYTTVEDEQTPPTTVQTLDGFGFPVPLTFQRVIGQAGEVIAWEWDVTLPDIPVNPLFTEDLLQGASIGFFNATFTGPSGLQLNHVPATDTTRITLGATEKTVTGSNQTFTVGIYANIDTGEIGYTFNGEDLGYHTSEVIPLQDGFFLIFQAQGKPALTPTFANLDFDFKVKTKETELTQPFPAGAIALCERLQEPQDGEVEVPTGPTNYDDVFENQDPSENGGGFYSIVYQDPAAYQDIGKDHPANQPEHEVRVMRQLSTTAQGGDMIKFDEGDAEPSHPLVIRNDMPSVLNPGQTIPDWVVFYSQTLLDDLQSTDPAGTLNPAKMGFQLFGTSMEGVPVLSNTQYIVQAFFAGDPQNPEDPSQIPPGFNDGVNCLAIVTEVIADATQTTGYKATASQYLNGLPAGSPAETLNYDPFQFGNLNSPYMIAGFFSLPYWAAQKLLINTKAHDATTVNQISQRLLSDTVKV